ncbi:MULTISPECIES: hypothetical protein [Nocardia]|nr:MULTISPECIES: hypothetical protein [Nocardia]
MLIFPFPAMIYVLHRRGITAILFAIGAVSGTVLSIEMGCRGRD